MVSASSLPTAGWNLLGERSGGEEEGSDLSWAMLKVMRVFTHSALITMAGRRRGVCEGRPSIEKSAKCLTFLLSDFPLSAVKVHSSLSVWTLFMPSPLSRVKTALD